MHIEQAKAIPLLSILESLGIKPSRNKGGDNWHLSPLRNEKTPSFKVNTAKNVWYDFGEGRGGDALSFVCAYLQSNHELHSVHDALRWLNNMTGVIHPVKPASQAKKHPALILKEEKTIEHRLLLKYLQTRCITTAAARKYIKELRVYNRETKKSLFALGFANEEGGYELRNPFFKGSLGAKSITFIRGCDTNNKGIHIFEGCMDFLSVVESEENKELSDDAIILNSLSCLNTAIGYIKNYGYKIAYTWLDNDEAGKAAQQKLAAFLKTEQDLQHRPMNNLYRIFKDVNEWHCHKLAAGE